MVGSPRAEYNKCVCNHRREFHRQYEDEFSDGQISDEDIEQCLEIDCDCQKYKRKWFGIAISKKGVTRYCEKVSMIVRGKEIIRYKDRHGKFIIPVAIIDDKIAETEIIQKESIKKKQTKEN